MNPWGNMTDSEFREAKLRLGDMALENPELAKSVVNDLRRDRKQPPIGDDTTIH